MELTIQNTVEVIDHHALCEALDVIHQYSLGPLVGFTQISREECHLLDACNLECVSHKLRNVEFCHLVFLEHGEVLSLLSSVSTQEVFTGNVICIVGKLIPFLL